MKKIDLGQTVTILANVGVIVGIAFLVLELQQNTQAARLASAQSYLAGGNNLDFQIAGDAEFAELLIRGDDEENDLTPAERLRLERWNYAVLRQWETAYYLSSIDALDEALWAAYVVEIRKILKRSDSLQRYWVGSRTSFTPEFRREIDALLENGRAP